MLTPFERYQQALSSGKYFADIHQEKIIAYLQILYHDLEEKRLFKKKKYIKGLYIWGSVGVGKTWMMDLFFESLNIKNKWRIHFHDFMRDIHDQLQRYQGKSDPLQKIAKDISKKTRLLCFDELFVHDIGDAMILGNLFGYLFKENITIVATSNVTPDDLYKDGLQRSRFIPAINLIKKNMEVLHLPTTKDYRLRELEAAGVFFCPADTKKTTQLFEQLAHGEIKHHKDIFLYDRPISTIAYSDNIIWLDFKKICHTPRSQMDYLSIAKRWHIVILDNLTNITETNIARYFINLIDILYDLKITLILNSHTELSHLYESGELLFEFKRTLSRLTEMQSTAYLKQAEDKLWKS